MSAFIKILKTVSRSLLYVSYAAIAAMAVMTVFNVIMRYIFNSPVIGVTEISQMLLIIAMTGLAHSCVEGRFIAVGAFVDHVPKKLNISIEVVMGAIALAFFFFVGWQLIVQVGVSYSTFEAYFMIKAPRWPMYLILGISFLATALATIAYVIERLRNFTPAKEKNVFDENPDLAILALSEDDDFAVTGEGGAKQ